MLSFSDRKYSKELNQNKISMRANFQMDGQRSGLAYCTSAILIPAITKAVRMHRPMSLQKHKGKNVNKMNLKLQNFTAVISQNFSKERTRLMMLAKDGNKVFNAL